jgi:hypothetical protein
VAPSAQKSKWHWARAPTIPGRFEKKIQAVLAGIWSEDEQFTAKA